MSKLAILSLIPCALFGLEQKPWIGNVWEFEFTPSLTYGRFSKVQDGFPQIKTPWNTYVLAFDLNVPPTDYWDFGAQAEFADTPKQSMGLRSLAVQIRHQTMNDVAYDPISLTWGFNVRGASRHSLSDVSCPYHSDVNFELTAALGKEWDHGYEWKMRIWGLAAAGMANHGFPWARGLVALESNQMETHRLGLFADGYFGFGDHNFVSINDFHGYASIRHQSVDVGVSYKYYTDIWGHLSLAYAYRVFARSYPERESTLFVSYTLPFSMF